MAKRKRTKRQATSVKETHRRETVEQHEPHYKPEVNFMGKVI
jgi:hypothetical protein